MVADGNDTEHGTKRLVVFDVEGILIPKNRYLLFEISRKLGFFGFTRIVALGFLYETGLLHLESAMRRIFTMFKGLGAEEFFQIHKKIPLTPGTEEVFKRLNKNGYRTALISSGLPTQVVKDFATRLQADYAYGLELEIIDERLTGVIGGDVIKEGGKAVVLERILQKENLTPKECVMVADDRNNISMFPLCKLRIGYNPDFVLTAKSDFVTRGALTEILPPITGENSPASPVGITKSRGLREAIHMGSFLLIFVCIYILGNVLVASLILLVTVLYTASEIARVREINIPILSLITWNAANKTELYEFATAPIHFALGIAISLLVFPAPTCYVAITMITLGDGCAHIFGMKFGRTHLPFNKGKNLEGTICGLIFAFLGATIFIDPTRALIVAAVGMLIEGLPLPINDNLTVPIAAGLMLSLIS
ncbi:HAD-IB family phosphatase [Candidatus Bathyarchaeota archaeon]|nr:HAD-IB family phosphatase [Candidatus Bathyarchaeota archaeon]